MDPKTKNNGPPTSTSAASSSSGDSSNTVNNASSSSNRSLVANYSDNSNSPDSDQEQDSKTHSPMGAGGAALEMEVDEDGAPLQSATPMLKRPSPDSTSNEDLDSSKKAKIDVENQEALDHNAALVTSSNDA